MSDIYESQTNKLVMDYSGNRCEWNLITISNLLPKHFYACIESLKSPNDVNEDKDQAYCGLTSNVSAFG